VKPPRIAWLAPALLAAAQAAAAPPDAAPTARAVDASRPNIILILADDAGIETVGAYGGEYRTPRLDQLAREGVRFENAHATPLCTPSRVRLLTGRYSFRNYKAFGHLGRDEPTLAKLLKGAGYRTALAGKWQLSGNPLDGVRGSTPRDAGFDEWSAWATGPDFLEDGCPHWGPTLDTNGVAKTYPGEFGSDLVHRFARDFVERDSTSPFFLYYSMILPHDPWVATPARPEAATREERFAAMLEYMDALVGDLLDRLDRKGFGANTLVVFVGDNGTDPRLQSQLRGRGIQGGKGSTRDAGTHVPLILRWPARIPASTAADPMVELTDVFATIASAGGEYAAAAASDGYDLLRGLADAAAPRRLAVFMDYAAGWWPLQTERYAFDARWKLYGDGRFFDVVADPDEQAPLPPERLDPQAQAARAALQVLLDRMGDRPLTLADPHFPAGFDPQAIDYDAVRARLMERARECGDPSRAAIRPSASAGTAASP
jgi:arylsulfatase A-like enzyme